MKTRLLIIFLALLTVQSIIAQDAKSILDKVSTAYAASPYLLKFTLNTQDVVAKTTFSHDGRAYLKGNKFKIEVPDGTTWFDGKTQWVLMDGNDEVNVTSPSGDELAAISPVALLGIYKTGFKLNYKGEKKENAKVVYVIEMISQQKNADVTKFVLTVDKATNLFTSIKIFSKDGTNNLLKIRQSEKSTLADSFFVFNKKDFPNVEVIDLR